MVKSVLNLNEKIIHYLKQTLNMVLKRVSLEAKAAPKN